MAGTQVRHNFAERMKGAALLDIDIYEEVEADTRSTLESAGVVALVAAAAAIGASRGGLPAVSVEVISAFAGWLIWAGITYLIGDKLLGGTATWGELLRTLGFAQTPRLLLVFAAVPPISRLVYLLVLVWILFTSVIALRQALDFSTARAILTGAIALVLIESLRLLALS